MQTFIKMPKGCKREKKVFSPEEDRLINFVVTIFGDRNWDYIASFINGRNAKQCRDRYMNYLKPGLASNEWTQKEDELILDLYLRYGPKWAIISKFFCNRNQISIKNRYKFLERSKSNAKTHKENDESSVEKPKNSDPQIENDDQNAVSNADHHDPDHNHDANTFDLPDDESLFNSYCDFDFDENSPNFPYF